MAAVDVAHDLQQYRYTTCTHRPLPWTHIRHVRVPELRHEPPDLLLMTNLIAGLSDCDVSLRDIREHNDTDILQLVEVLQACLQFTLWSQNILKEKLLELQAFQVAKRVSARQLDSMEARCQALGKEVAALTSERDTLSLGTANLRTSLVQMETTIKMQERQLKQERERTAQLVTKLEKALTQAPQLPRPSLSTPAAPSKEPLPWLSDSEGRLCCPTCGRHATRGTRHRTAHRSDPAALLRHVHSSHAAPADTLSADATSYTDSLLPAEAEVYRHGAVPGGVFPAPCVDWRTLVRYIIHEEKRTAVWPSPQAPSPAEAPPTAPAAAVSPEMAEQLQALVSTLTASITADVVDFAQSTATQTQTFLSHVTEEKLREMAAAQQSLAADVRAALGSLPPLLHPPPTSSSVVHAPVTDNLPALALPAPSRPPPSPVIRATTATSAAPAAAAAAPTAATTNTMNAASGNATLKAAPTSITQSVALPGASSQLTAASSADLPTSFVRAAAKPTTAASFSPLPAQASTASALRASQGSLLHYSYGDSVRSQPSGYLDSPKRFAQQPPSLFNSLAESPRGIEGGAAAVAHASSSPYNRYSSLGDLRGSAGGSRGSLPVFSPDILRTPHQSASESSAPHSTNSSGHTTATSPIHHEPTAARAAAEVDSERTDDIDDDNDPPDADYRLPSSTNTSSTREDSYQSSTDAKTQQQQQQQPGMATAGGVALGASSTYHALSLAKPIVAASPLAYPPLSPQAAGSPLSATPSPGAYSLYRSLSLQSSMHSEESGASAHASSQMLRDTQKELEALLAEDAAAERLKKRSGPS